MSMTKKDFIALADAWLNEIRCAAVHDVATEFLVVRVDNVQRMLADFCASQNPRFNRARWLAYINGKCGASGGKVKP